jgi:homoserine kinase
MLLGFQALGLDAPGIRLQCENAIPHGRGLGSSSAAIVGGLAVARALVADGAERMHDDALFELAAALEGHPDNVAPAVYGGLTIAYSTDDSFQALRLDVASGLSFVVFVPPDPLETAVARGLLPATVTHADASYNAGRAGLLVAALTGHPELLFAATADRLHQDYRAPAMPRSGQLVEALRADGIAAVVSGAGPTVLAIVPPDRAREVADRAPVGWWARELPVDVDGVRPEPVRPSRTGGQGRSGAS